MPHSGNANRATRLLDTAWERADNEPTEAIVGVGYALLAIADAINNYTAAVENAQRRGENEEN